MICGRCGGHREVAWAQVQGEEQGREQCRRRGGAIRAETVAFDQLNTAGSLVEAKKQGVVRQEGRDYEVKDGDVMEVLFSK